MLLASFARLPVGALQGDAHQPYLGHLRYSVRHIDLSDVRVDKRKLDVRIRSADLATAARRGATRRPRAGGDADGGDESDGGNWSDDELMAPSAEPEVPRRAPRGPPVAAAVRLDGGAAGGPAAAHEFSAAPAVRPLAKLMKPASARVAPEGPRELLRLVLRDVELPLAGLKWAFAQSQWPYAADAGVAAAALHGLCVTVTLAALPRPGSPAEPRLCIAEVSVAVQRVELLVEGTLLSSLYNAAASALSSQLRDYVQDALEAALRAEADLRLRDVDDYLRQHHLWPLIFALAKVDRAVDRAADAGHGAAGRPERASPAAGRSERASPAAGAGGAAAPDAAEGRTAAGPAPRPGDAADDAWRVEALRPDVPAELWPLDDARDDRRVRH
ncbi:hypothetical protein M885DRAFT_537064 [Pelagophyceae sp. CCMP2097]|nr:hypothetical protein M885DRAFT_537064 [Pelagophyceae sp. CCMP2097]